MPRYREKGSTDRKSFSEPESSITLDWSNRGTDTGLPRPTGISLIFNTPEITAKKITVIANQKGNQWNDKGIIYDQKDVSHGKITAAGIIFVETYDDCIYMNSPAHTVDITGFKKLIFKSAGTPLKGSSGYAIMNNGIDNYLNIIGSETNTGQRAVIADNSSTARSTKTTPTANAIHLHANASSYAIVQTKAHHSFTGGQIEINGIDKTIITNEKDGGTAVSAQASGEGKGLIEINKKTSGVVEITGAVTASNGTADIDFAGDPSFLKGNMTSSGEKGKILADFKDADSQMTGDMKTSSTAAIDATFSGENAVLTGNINTMETSYQWGYGYVPNRSTVTVTFSGKNASFAGNIDTTQTSRTGTWGNYVDSPNHSTVTASFSGLGASFTGDLASAGTSKANIALTKSGSLERQSYNDGRRHDGTGSSFIVQPTDIASVDAMKFGDKLYFAQVKERAAAFKVDHDIKLQNKNSLFDNTLSINKERDTEKADYEDWFITPVGDGKTPNSNAFTPGSAHHSAISIWRESDTLLKRLGELRYNQEDQGLWARYINSKLTWDGKITLIRP